VIPLPFAPLTLIKTVITQRYDLTDVKEWHSLHLSGIKTEQNHLSLCFVRLDWMFVSYRKPYCSAQTVPFIDTSTTSFQLTEFSSNVNGFVLHTDWGDNDVSVHSDRILRLMSNNAKLIGQFRKGNFIKNEFAHQWHNHVEFSIIPWKLLSKFTNCWIIDGPTKRRIRFRSLHPEHIKVVRKRFVVLICLRALRYIMLMRVGDRETVNPRLEID
jgi:hypothetical protein